MANDDDNMMIQHHFLFLNIFDSFSTQMKAIAIKKATSNTICPTYSVRCRTIPSYIEVARLYAKVQTFQGYLELADIS